MNPEGTKQRILEAAETLFAERGFAATSLRAITAEAGVNLAAVHYHYGSKEALFGHVFARRIGPVNDERLRALDALEAGSETPPSIEAVLEALLRPALQLAKSPGGSQFMRLAGRIYTEPGTHWEAVGEQFEEVRDRFLGVLHRSVPDLSPTDLFWRANFTIGVMCHAMSDTHRLAMISDGQCNSADVETLLNQMVPFLAGGFRAPVVAPVEGGDA